MPKAAWSFLPFRDLWLPVLPLLPLILATMAVSPIIDGSERLNFLRFYGEEPFIDNLQREYVHLRDLLTYFAVASVHVIVCLTVMF